MIAVRVLGDSGAGKTTLIERLVPAVADRGRVATIKSIHHSVEIDDEGTDTHRHRVAGAERVVGITPTLTATFDARGKDDYEAESGALVALLSDLRDGGYDYVLIEGFSGASLPAIVLGDGDRSGERTIARVEAGASADIDRLVDLIEDLDRWRGEP